MLDGFFEAVRNLLFERSGVKNADALARLNPNRIYIEQIRDIFNISSRKAQRYCDSAARQGLFQKFVEVVCPDGAVAAIAESEASLPESVCCRIEHNGSYRDTVYSTGELSKNVFYRLKDEATPSGSYSGTTQGIRSHTA